MLTEVKEITYNVAPDDNIAILFTETEKGFSAEFFLRSSPLTPYSRPLPAEDGCCIWNWNEDVEEFIQPFLNVTGYTNLHEIMRTISVFNFEEN